MNLYTITIATEVVVLADDERDALRIARSLNAIDLDLHDFDYTASPMRHMPAGWDSDSIPFGHSDPADPDRPLSSWIDAGHAPEYAALIAWLRKGKP